MFYLLTFGLFLECAEGILDDSALHYLNIRSLARRLIGSDAREDILVFRKSLGRDLRLKSGGNLCISGLCSIDVRAVIGLFNVLDNDHEIINISRIADIDAGVVKSGSVEALIAPADDVVNSDTVEGVAYFPKRVFSASLMASYSLTAADALEVPAPLS